MAKRQTRRSLSVRPQHYEMLSDLKRVSGKSRSEIVEELIEAKAKEAGLELMDRSEAVLRQQGRRKQRRPGPNPGAYFTF